MTFDAEMPQRVAAYLAARPQDKHGSHHYSAEEFGLDRAQIRSDFAPYTEAFNVPAE